ncbi:MAG: ferrous iron transport protein A [Candidatus Thorarchaeota archaeon]
MDNKGTPIETLTNKTLTSMKSGTLCKLVGISDEGSIWDGFGKHKHRGWGERRHGHHWFRPGFHKKHVQGGQRILRRLLDLGLTKGCSFKVIQASRTGPVLVEVRGTRIALGHGIARRIIVAELEGPPQ